MLESIGRYQLILVQSNPANREAGELYGNLPLNLVSGGRKPLEVDDNHLKEHSSWLAK